MDRENVCVSKFFCFHVSCFLCCHLSHDVWLIEPHKEHEIPDREFSKLGGKQPPRRTLFGLETLTDHSFQLVQSDLLVLNFVSSLIFLFRLKLQIISTRGLVSNSSQHNLTAFSRACV